MQGCCLHESAVDDREAINGLRQRELETELQPHIAKKRLARAQP
jgi:hypothetical protein